jgi:predicted transcriptional regulator
MSEATFTFRVDEALKNEFTAAAKARDRSGAQLLRDFMRDFVRQQQETADHDAWFRRQVQIGLDVADAGAVLSADEVEAEAAAWRAETRRRLSGSAA